MSRKWPKRTLITVFDSTWPDRPNGLEYQFFPPKSLKFSYDPSLSGAVQLQAGDIFKAESLADPGNRRLSKMKMGQSEIEREAKKQREALEAKRAQREKIEEEIRRRALMKKRNSIFARRISSVGGSDQMSEGEDNHRKETFFKRARKSIVAFAYASEAEKPKERNHSIGSRISERRGTVFVQKVVPSNDTDME